MVKYYALSHISFKHPSLLLFIKEGHHIAFESLATNHLAAFLHTERTTTLPPAVTSFLHQYGALLWPEKISSRHHLESNPGETRSQTYWAAGVLAAVPGPIHHEVRLGVQSAVEQMNMRRKMEEILERYFTQLLAMGRNGRMRERMGVNDLVLLQYITQ
jgi:hypothetical protein